MSDEKRVLTREQFLNAFDVKLERVELDGLGGAVYVRNLSAKARDAFEGSRIRVRENNRVEMVHDNTRARLVSMTACDEHGVLLFTEEDVEALGQKNAADLDKLFDVAQRLSGLTPQAMEEKLKNSGAALTVNSSSVLH